MIPIKKTGRKNESRKEPRIYLGSYFYILEKRKMNKIPPKSNSCVCCGKPLYEGEGHICKDCLKGNKKNEK